MKSALALCSALALSLTGCSTVETLTAAQEEQLKMHQFYIDKNGELLDPIKKEKIEDENDYINDVLVNFQKSGAKKLTIYVHGGLNTFESATSRVMKVKPEKILAEEGNYLLFISWHSGPFTNYSDHLFLLRRGQTAEFLGPLSSPFVLAEDALRSIARIPASTYNVVIGQNSVVKKVGESDEDFMEGKLSLLKGASYSIHNSHGSNEMEFKDWWTVINPVKLVTAPFVDGLGTGAWNSMLRRTDLVLRKDTAFADDPKENTRTAVSKFLNLYAGISQNVNTTIIGHSMGSIIVNNIVANYPDIRFDNIVFMAAACRLKDVEYVIAPYIQKNTSSHFYNLSLNPYRDIAENTYYDFIPRGSLLMWIDDILGSNNSFQDRTAGYWLNMMGGADETFRSVADKNRIHLTKFAISGNVPIKHGSFDDFDFWKNSFWQGEVKLP